MAYSKLHQLTDEDKKAIARVVSSKDFAAIEKLFNWKMDVIVDTLLGEPDPQKSYGLKFGRITVSELLGHLYQYAKEVEDKKKTVPEGIQQEAKTIFGPRA